MEFETSKTGLAFVIDKKIKSEGFANLYDFLLNQSNNSILYDYDLYDHRFYWQYKHKFK